MSGPGLHVQRITGYRHLTPLDLVPPGRRNVFFDPIDTEVGIWATVDLLEPGCTVLDLGSGSGAAAAAMARAGAGHVHGLDIAEDSVLWACEHYALADPNWQVSFALADYTTLTTPQLLDRCPFRSAPAIVTSNPPYVPLSPPSAGKRRVSIDGGPDGLRLVRHVLRHAAGLGSDLALTIGSYTSPRAATQLLRASGYRIAGVTLGALPLGEYTAQNRQRVAALAASGKGPLLEVRGVVHYLVVGFSCRRIQSAADRMPGPDDVLAMLRRACESDTTELEALDDSPVAGLMPLRILILRDELRRRHH